MPIPVIESSPRVSGRVYKNTSAKNVDNAKKRVSPHAYGVAVWPDKPTHAFAAKLKNKDEQAAFSLWQSRVNATPPSRIS